MTTIDATAPAFRIGGVLGRSFSILFQNIVPFGVIALLFTLPSSLIFLASGTQLVTPTGVPADGFAGVIALVMVVQLVSYTVATGSLVYGTFQALRGRRPGLGACLGRGFRLILPVIGVMIVYWIAMMVGFVLLIIPGFIVLIMFWLALPAAVVERPGVFASLSRSRALTKGSRWRILGLILVVGIIVGVVSAIVSFGVGFENPGEIGVGSILNLIVSAFTTAMWAIASAVAYHDLRVAKEGLNIEDLAAVFD